MTISEYFGDWSKVIDLQETQRIINKLLSSSVTICPQIEDIFNAFKLCPLSKLRVVVIGQDPYNDIYQNKPRATGLAFANTLNTLEKFYSPSLSVLKESVIDYTKPHGIVTFDASLEKWEKQGVLLLNSSLSCAAGQPNSHMLLWRPFTKSLLTKLSENNPGLVYVLMGNTAQSFEPYINTKFNFIFKTKHPAYYVRCHERMPSDIWKQINKILIDQSGYGIEWYNEE